MAARKKKIETLPIYWTGEIAPPVGQTGAMGNIVMSMPSHRWSPSVARVRASR